MATEWVPTEELFKEFPGLLAADHTHKKRVIEHWLGPELQDNVLRQIIFYIREGTAKDQELEWLIGCYIMRVYPEDRHIDFGYGQLHDPRVERVAQLLLEAPSLAEESR